MTTALLEADLQALDDEAQRTVNEVWRCRDALRRTVTPNGGIHRGELLKVLEGLPVLTSRPTGGTFAPDQLAFTAENGRVSFSAHGGRAHTNNEVVIAVLAAAASPSVRTHVALVPARYKNTHTAIRARDQLASLLDQPGVSLELDHVVLMVY